MIPTLPAPQAQPYRRLLGFIVCYGLLHLAMRVDEDFLRWYIEGLTVPVATGLINAFGDPAVPASAQGSRIVSPGGGLNVLQGCEGLDVMGLWLAAVCAGAFSWRGRWLGWTIGAALVFGFNQARLVSLYGLYRGRREWFGDAHGLWWPLALVLLVFLLYLAWQRCFPPREPAPA